MDTSTILFVDDEQRITNALSRALRHEPYRVFTASSAADGLVILGEEKIDIVVSDERMPGMSGCEFLSCVRNEYPAVIRIILTGEASMNAAISAINDGEVYRFLTKPCNADDLKITLRQAVLQKRLVEESQKLLEHHRRQSAYLEQLEAESPGILEVRSDDQGAILVSDNSDDVEALLNEMQSQFKARKAS